jgi:catechol 2,3-dioxygenase-like lactoylglutathione lyase family enzyme
VELDHVQLAMPAGREAEADTFYRDLLAMTVLEKPPVLAARGGRWYQKGRCQIHLGVDPDFRPATKAHPGIVVPDYEALLDRLTASGVAVRPNDEIAGLTRCHVDDPFGNRLEFIKPQ